VNISSIYLHYTVISFKLQLNNRFCQKITVFPSLFFFENYWKNFAFIMHQGNLPRSLKLKNYFNNSLAVQTQIQKQKHTSLYKQSLQSLRSEFKIQTSF